MNQEDQLYNDLYKKAADLQYKFHGFTTGANDPHVHVLQNEIHQLIGDIRGRKDTQALETRIHNIEHQIDMGRHIPQPYMNYGHSDLLHNSYEEMRHNLLDFEKKQ